MNFKKDPKIHTIAGQKQAKLHGSYPCGGFKDGSTCFSKGCLQRTYSNPHLPAWQSRPSELVLQVHPLLYSIAGEQEILNAYPPPFIFAHLPPSVCTSSDLLSPSSTPPVKILICPSWLSSKPHSLIGPSRSPAPNLCSPRHGDFSPFLKCIVLYLV